MTLNSEQIEPHMAGFLSMLGDRLRLRLARMMFGIGQAPEQRAWLPAEPFGIVDTAGRSVTVWREGELLGYGGAGAARTVAQAYSDWTALGLPGLAGMSLEVIRADGAPNHNGQRWVEQRGKTALVWRSLPHAASWHQLLYNA